MFEPGDQKVFGPTAFGSPSSRCANRIYAVIMFVVGAVGVACLLTQQWLMGVILTLAGIVGTTLFLRPEISERLMIRRMRKRDADETGEGR